MGKARQGKVKGISFTYRLHIYLFISTSSLARRACQQGYSESLHLLLKDRPKMLEEMKQQLEAFVNVLEEKVSTNGIIEPRYLNYLRNNFKKEEVTLILRNLGVKKLDKREYSAAVNIFETAIRDDKDNPYLHLFLGIAFCGIQDLSAIKKAKTELDLAKNLIEKEEASDYREQHLSILEKYLGYFKYPFERTLMPNEREPINTKFYLPNNSGQINSVGDNNNINR
jgi:hypothetical protein